MEGDEHDDEISGLLGLRLAREETEVAKASPERASEDHSTATDPTSSGSSMSGESKKELEVVGTLAWISGISSYEASDWQPLSDLSAEDGGMAECDELAGSVGYGKKGALSAKERVESSPGMVREFQVNFHRGRAMTARPSQRNKARSSLPRPPSGSPRLSRRPQTHQGRRRERLARPGRSLRPQHGIALEAAVLMQNRVNTLCL